MIENIKYIIGIDEVGRGPIAGPVAVCAFLCRPRFFDTLFLDSAISPTYGKEKEKSKKKNLPIRDSKKLTKKQREKWHKYLSIKKEEGECDFAVFFVSSENIDKHGIVKCIQKAVNKSLEKVTTQNSQNFSRFTPEGPYTDKNLENSAPYYIYLDGGLRAPKEFIYQETIIKGDETHSVISLASIIAKVSRDRVMYRYAKEFPEYGFDKHVGYGTKAHYEAIAKHGQLPIHRKSFIH